MHSVYLPPYSAGPYLNKTRAKHALPAKQPASPESGGLKGQIRSTRRRFRLAELVCFDHSADAYVIDAAFRNFFDTRHPSPSADKCTGASFPGRHNRKSDFHSYTHSLVDPEVKAARRNIACPSKDWLELPEVGIEPDFDLKD